MSLRKLSSHCLLAALAIQPLMFGACSSKEKPQLERGKAQQTRQRSDNADREMDQAMDETQDDEQSR